MGLLRRLLERLLKSKLAKWAGRWLLGQLRRMRMWWRKLPWWGKLLLGGPIWWLIEKLLDKLFDNVIGLPGTRRVVPALGMLALLVGAGLAGFGSAEPDVSPNSQLTGQLDTGSPVAAVSAAPVAQQDVSARRTPASVGSSSGVAPARSAQRPSGGSVARGVTKQPVIPQNQSGTETTQPAGGITGTTQTPTTAPSGRDPS